MPSPLIARLEKHKRALIGLSIAAPLGVAYLTVWPKELQLHCPVRMATGYLCPGCGATRACEALIQGDFASAWALSPLFLMGPLIFVAAWWVQRQNKPWLKRIFYTAFGLGVAWFTLWRNAFI
jgi:hypothetical protein